MKNICKTLNNICDELFSLKNSDKAKGLQRFFKTGKGEYGVGDIFLGITVPLLRQVSNKYLDLSLGDLQILFNSKIHEYRMIALFVLIKKEDKRAAFDFYLKNTRNINNWDLVDLSAPKIIGDYLLNRDKSILSKLARSNNLWERRIAVLSTFAFIKNNNFGDSLKIAEILINDEHDLIHKAVGWMLREVGKRDLKTEEEFLEKNYRKMPRTCLRYAIEKFSEEKRRAFLN